MQKRYFSKRNKRRLKTSLKKYPGLRTFSAKRMGGILGVSVLVERRNLNAFGLSNNKKEIL
jgi:hypothetical protein